MIALTFDDVLIIPKFNFTNNSRKDVDVSSNFLGLNLKIPVISANMDTITEAMMCRTMAENGGIGCLHRFMSIEDNVIAFNNGINTIKPIVSIGLGNKEIERAEALYNKGATHFCIDVANGAQLSVVKQYNILREIVSKNGFIIVGNFATGKSITDFINNIHYEDSPDAFKVGIGPGSACTTRIKTGVGIPQFHAIRDCVAATSNIIADGGLRYPGDIAKALAAGAQMVMIGGMLAGTEETPGEVEEDNNYDYDPDSRTVVYGTGLKYKKYRGSASKESYELQGKSEDCRTAEGESFLVLYKGPVKNVLKDIEGGLRSSLTYTNSSNLDEFRKNAEFIQISNNALKESGAHGKNI